jgi:hypothetical protein
MWEDMLFLNSHTLPQTIPPTTENFSSLLFHILSTTSALSIAAIDGNIAREAKNIAGRPKNIARTTTFITDISRR